MEKSVEKALRILEIIGLSEGSLGVSEIAEMAGYPVSTAHRLLGVLVKAGFLYRVGRGYRIGLKVWEIGAGSGGIGGLVRECQEAMEYLAAETEETIHLAVRDGCWGVYVARIASSQRVGCQTRVGQRVPLFCTATGKALLAFESEAVIRSVLENGLVAYTDKTVVDEGAIKVMLKEVRRLGYSSNDGEYDDQIGGVAAPIRNWQEKVVAAVGVAGPRYRFTEERLRTVGKVVLEVAQSVRVSDGTI